MQGKRNTEEDFWLHVDMSGGPDACWEWQLTKTPLGYGNWTLDGKPQLAHRMAFIYKNGVIPEGHVVMHDCDNPPCCNYKHLITGTQKENIQDKHNKGRAAPQKGELNHGAKLKQIEADEIKLLYKTKKYTQLKLGNMFNISRAMVSLIVRGKNW